MNVYDNDQLGRWPPERCDMPDLSDLHGNLTFDYFLNRYFRRAGLQMEGSGQAQFLNLVRLVDKTLLEYESARQYLQQYVDSDNRTSLFMRCVDHMENCIDSLNRAFAHLEGLKTSLHYERSRTSQPMPQIDRQEIPSARNKKRINDIRDAIQHMDDRISKGRAGADTAPIGLNVKSDSIELDNEEIYFDELAHWVRQVYAVTERLAGYTA
jgi:hypothetical protein